MTLDDIRIEHIKTGQLVDFAKKAIGNAGEGQFVPITMQRAIAHANDPCRQDEDVSLLVAIDSDDEIRLHLKLGGLIIGKRGQEFEIQICSGSI